MARVVAADAFRACERCGFTVEGRLREAPQRDGERHDVLVMGLLRTDPRRTAG